MKKLILALTLAMTTMTAAAQSDFDRSTDKENGMTVFKGQCTFEDLDNESSFTWLDKGIKEYKPDSATVQYLKKNLPQYEVVIMLGTWCDDSHNMVPKLFKTLEAANYPMSQYKMYGLDRAKETKYIEHKLYRIEKLPTIVLVRKNTEVGRITETVKQSIEADMAKMIEADMGQR